MSAEQSRNPFPELSLKGEHLFPITKPIPSDLIHAYSRSLGSVRSHPDIQTIRNISDGYDSVERQINVIMNSVRGSIYEQHHTEAYWLGSSFMLSTAEHQTQWHTVINGFAGGQFLREILAEYRFVTLEDKSVIETYQELTKERRERQPIFAGMSAELPSHFEALVEYGFKQEDQARQTRIMGREPILSKAIENIVRIKNPVLRKSFLGGITDTYYLHQTQHDVRNLPETC